MHYYKIIWIVCVFWLNCNGVLMAPWSMKMAWAMWFDCLRVVRINFTVRASSIVFLFVNNDNNNFIKEIKHVRASIACWKLRQNLWEFSSRWKPSTASRVFTDLLSNSPNRSARFSPGYEGTENMYHFLNIINMATSSRTKCVTFTTPLK